MASISQSHCYFREDEEEFCQVSAAFSNNYLQVPPQIFHGESSPIVTMVSSYGRGEMYWAHDQNTFTGPQQMQSCAPVKSDPSSFVVPERLGYSDHPDVPPGFYSSLCRGCYDFDDRFKPHPQTQTTNVYSVIHQGKQVPLTDDSSSKVGRYTVEERKDKILRYLKKRNQRNFNKTIKYACRKTLADRRVRVRGRFARNDDSCDEETSTKKNIEASQQQNELVIFSNDVQIKHDNDDDQWLQEAMTSLICMPYISGC